MVINLEAGRHTLEVDIPSKIREQVLVLCQTHETHLQVPPKYTKEVMKIVIGFQTANYHSSISDMVLATYYIVLLQNPSPLEYRKVIQWVEFPDRPFHRLIRDIAAYAKIQWYNATPEAALSRICADLQILDQVQMIKTSYQILKPWVSGQSPSGVLAAIIYIILKNRRGITQVDIGKACGVSDVTLRKNARWILPHLQKVRTPVHDY